MSISSEIVQNIQQVARRGGKIELINDYLGLQISYEAVLLGFGVDTIVFQVHEYQLVCMEISRRVILKVDSLFPSIASVASTHSMSNRAVLTNFSYAPALAGNRAAVRVRPKEDVPIRLTSVVQTTDLGSNLRHNPPLWHRGQLADISTGGIGVIADLWMNRVRDFTASRGSQVNVLLAVTLPADNGGAANRLPNKELFLRGIVSNIILLDAASRYRIGIKTSPDESGTKAISRYSALRQAQIIREIKALYAILLRK